MCCLSVITYSRTQTKLKGLVAKFDGTKSSKNGAKGVSEDMKRDTPENPKIFNGKVTCCCSWEHRILQEEITFLKDQRTSRKMMESFLENVKENKPYSENLKENDSIIFLEVL